MVRPSAFLSVTADTLRTAGRGRVAGAQLVDAAGSDGVGFVRHSASRLRLGFGAARYEQRQVVGAEVVAGEAAQAVDAHRMRVASFSDRPVSELKCSAFSVSAVKVKPQLPRLINTEHTGVLEIERIASG